MIRSFRGSYRYRGSGANELCSDALHTQNRTKGTSEARLLSLRFIEPMKVKPSGY